MLRNLFLLFLFSGLFLACVKPASKDPVPSAEFIDFYAFKRAAGDTATMVLGYEDGDGDLFVSDNTEGPTLVFTPYYYNEQSNSLKPFVFPGGSDTFLITQNVKQPADGYYKGRSIKGTITLPMTEFRPDNSYKILQFKGYLMDTKGHRSNVVSSPVYTLTF